MEPIQLCFELSRSSKKSQNLKNGNEMINANDTLFFHVKKELTQHLRRLSNNEIRQHIGDLEEHMHIFSMDAPCYIIVKIAPPTNRKMDTPNWYPTVKALMDGLTDAGLFEDDNDRVITSMTFIPQRKTANKKYRIILEIHPGYLGGVDHA